jgi:plastocyanin
MNDARPSFTRARRVAAALAVAGLLLGLAACGDDDDDDESSGTTATTEAESGGGGGGDATLEVTEFQFEDVTAPAGGTLAVTNDSSGAHTFTADDGAFDESLPVGETVDVQVPSDPGEYPFHCEIHPSMHATLTVQ